MKKQTPEKYAYALNMIRIYLNDCNNKYSIEMINMICLRANVTRTLFWIAGELGYFDIKHGMAYCKIPEFHPYHGRTIAEKNNKRMREYHARVKEKKDRIKKQEERKKAMQLKLDNLPLPQKLEKPLEESIIDLKTSNPDLSLRDIANQLGTNHNTVNRVLKKSNISTSKNTWTTFKEKKQKDEFFEIRIFGIPIYSKRITR